MRCLEWPLQPSSTKKDAPSNIKHISVQSLNLQERFPSLVPSSYVFSVPCKEGESVRILRKLSVTKESSRVNNNLPARRQMTHLYWKIHHQILFLEETQWELTHEEHALLRKEFECDFVLWKSWKKEQKAATEAIRQGRQRPSISRTTSRSAKPIL